VRLRPIVMLLLICFPFAMNGQGHLFNNPQVLLASDTFEPFLIEAGLINDDQWPDLIVTTQEEVLVYLNDTEGNYHEYYEVIGFGNALIENLLVGDFSGDGFDDIFLQKEGELWPRIYVNEGDVGLVYDLNVVQNQIDEPFLVDLDKDGHLDILDGEQWFRNDGTGGFTQIQIVPDSLVETLDVGDVDGDGDLDILFIVGDVDIHIALNDGNQNFELQTEPSIVMNDASLPAAFFFDYNEDGFVDILANRDGKLRWFSNNGSFEFSEESWVHTYDVIKMQFVNMDADEKPEIVLLDHFGRHHIKKNVGLADYEYVDTNTPGNLTNAESFATLDMDLDGDYEQALVIGDQASVIIVENVGIEIVPQPAHLTKTINETSELHIEDFDNNGEDDFCFRHDSYISIYFNPSTEGWFAPITLPHGAIIIGFGLVDVNFDGNVDIVISDFLHTYWYENFGDGSFDGEKIMSGLGEIESIEPRDFDGDGFLDLALDNKILFSNEGDLTTGYFESGVVPIQGNVSKQFLYEDVNHDGHVDIVIAYLFFPITCFFNNGAGDFDSSLELADPNAMIPVANVPETIFADLNGDGQKKLIANLTGLIEFTITEDSFEERSLTTFPSLREMLVYDYDGDGDDDLLLFGDNAKCLINDGQGLIQNEVSISFNYTPRMFHCYDYNSDGVLDVGFVADVDNTETDKLLYSSPMNPGSTPWPTFEINVCGGFSFQNTSAVYIPVTSVLWEFGDASTSTEFQPDSLEDYFVQGELNYVSLTLCNQNGCNTLSQEFEYSHYQNLDIPESAVVNETVIFSANEEGYNSVSWVLSDGTVSLESSFSHTFIEPGVYDLEIYLTDDSIVDCTYTETRSITVEPSVLGIDHNSAQQLLIWPNPSRGELHLQWNDAQLESLHLYNTLSQVIIEKRTLSENETLLLEQLDSGVYFLELRLNGGEVLIEKVIVD